MPPKRKTTEPTSAGTPASSANDTPSPETKKALGNAKRQNTSAAAVPPSPVLHGLKHGCLKRSTDGPTPMSTGKMHRRTSAEDMAHENPLNRRKATLVLEDGTRFEGRSFGAEVSVSGEVVFNTAMVGYPEALTDPSYRGQLLTLTYPLVGNYGVPPDTKDDLGLSVYYESEKIHITALIVSEYSTESCHWNQVRVCGGV